MSERRAPLRCAPPAPGTAALAWHGFFNALAFFTRLPCPAAPRVHYLPAYQHAAGAEVGVRGAIERLLGTSGRDRVAVQGAVRAFLEQQGLSSPDEVAAIVGFLRPAVGERLRPSGRPQKVPWQLRPGKP